MSLKVTELYAVKTTRNVYQSPSADTGSTPKPNALLQSEFNPPVNGVLTPMEAALSLAAQYRHLWKQNFGISCMHRETPYLGIFYQQTQ